MQHCSQKEEKDALDIKPSTSVSLASLEDSGGLQEIPQGFRRLSSPRSYKQAPDAFQKALKSQVECLPMSYADELQGHLVDMRSLLGPGVWDRVQKGVDTRPQIFSKTSVGCPRVVQNGPI
jgi:hypothetical protein